jgi:hypothetical protein
MGRIHRVAEANREGGTRCRLSRREFVGLGAVGAAAAPFVFDYAPRKRPAETAQEIVALA